MPQDLNPENAFIWRIIHIRNLPWILENGLHSANSVTQDSHYFPIGNIEVINIRENKSVPLPPGGTLSDYIPFYFTPFSPMMFNIHTGRGVIQYPNNEIIILVAKLRVLHECGIKFLFSDRNACHDLANFFDNLDDLDKLPWQLWQNRDFQRDLEDPEKMDRYQAEALIYQHLPIENLQGIVCYTDELKLQISTHLNNKNLLIKVVAKPGWYFP